MTDMTQAGAPPGAAVSTGADEDSHLRSATWSLLGNLLGRPPDENTLALLGRIEADEAGAENLLAGAWAMLRSAAARSSPAELIDEYHELFIGIGRGELVPYGSWYLTGFLMEQPLAKLRVDLEALGFERQEGVCEPEDHAAALCDVMGMISAGEAAASLEEQGAFFERHMAPWMARFFRDLQAAPSARFYRAVGGLGEQVIEVEREYLNVTGRESPVRFVRKDSRPS